MACNKAFLSFLLNQLSPLTSITYRSMMGEYILYYHGKIAAYLCDDRLLIKPVAAAKALLPNAPLEAPYPGAGKMLLVENLADPIFLQQLFLAIEPQLPLPRKQHKN